MTTCVIPAARITADTATILEISESELDLDADLSDLGLDSIRLMTLVDRWRGDGFDVDFVTLASGPVLSRWIDVLGGDSR